MLTKLGLDPVRDFTHIITSGEVAYHLLRYLSTRDGETDIVDISDDSSSSSLWVPKGIPTPLLKRSASTLKVFCFGSGDEDEDYLTSCGWDLANSMDDADLIVARGPFTILTAQGQISRPEPGQDSDESETTYQAAMDDALQVAARRCVPMVVANPDKVRPDADKSPMPGTIGMAYEEALVRVHPSMKSADVAELIFYVGKPFEDVYEIALRGRDLSRACMVGDALETDITGASTVGIDSIWVIQDGIHNDEVEKKGNGSMKDGCHSVLTDFNALGGTYAKGRHLQPTFIAPHFQW
jgi:ribonucleotide monophosphatase NagD (HAD superfamily)